MGDHADGERPEEAAKKKVWKRPKLERVGDLREIILGSGKAGSNADMDPMTTSKPGTG